MRDTAAAGRSTRGDHMIEYNTRLVRWAELWFGEPEIPGRFDAVIHHRSPVRSKAGRCTDFFTLQVDLRKSIDELFAAVSRNTRAQIRKSTEVDEFRFDFIDHPSVSEIESFIAFYDEFADATNLPRVQRARLYGLLKSGSLSLSKVSTPTRTMTWHANMSRDAHVGLLFSASHFRSEDSPEMRKAIGRANRRLHWEEFLRYKKQGLETYDFGGWYDGVSDSRKLSINRFKEEFGGTRVLTFTIVEDRRFRAKFKTLIDKCRALATSTGKSASRVLVSAAASTVGMRHTKQSSSDVTTRVRGVNPIASTFSRSSSSERRFSTTLS
jgi:hypothetical protein